LRGNATLGYFGEWGEISRLEAVLVALEAGKPSGEHVLNVLARLKDNAPPANLHEALAHELSKGWPVQLYEEPLANVDRYDDLRSSTSTRTPSTANDELKP
jgi:hypothetical protein